MRRIVPVVVGTLGLLVARPAGAYTGCPPDTANASKCEGAVAKAFAKLIGAVVTCHAKQAQAALRGKPFDEDACEDGASAKSAKAKFDAQIAKLAPTCSPALLAGTASLAQALLGGPTSLDAQNGLIFCDSASGARLDPSGDDAGFRPSSTGSARCATAVAKNVAKLVKDLLTCHRKKADADFKAKTFDVVGCETRATGKYDGRAASAIAGGACPACLDAAGQTLLRTILAAQLDAADPLVFLCPTTTTSTSVTTTSSTSLTTTTSTSTTSTSVTTTTSTSTTSTSVTTTSSSSTSSTSTTSTSVPTTSSTSSTSTSVTTTTSTSTTSTMLGTVCGNHVVTPPETCDDGNAVDESDAGVPIDPIDTCPKNCRIGPCTAGAGSPTASVLLVLPAGVTLFLDYPDAKVAIAGTGGGVSASITNLPAGVLNAPNDLEYGLLDVMVTTSSINAGRLFTVAFQSCQAAPAIQAADFTCRVKDASDSFGLPVDGVTCTVTVP